MKFKKGIVVFDFNQVINEVIDVPYELSVSGMRPSYVERIHYPHQLANCVGMDVISPDNRTGVVTDFITKEDWFGHTHAFMVVLWDFDQAVDIEPSSKVPDINLAMVSHIPYEDIVGWHFLYKDYQNG